MFSTPSILPQGEFARTFLVTELIQRAIDYTRSPGFRECLRILVGQVLVASEAIQNVSLEDPGVEQRINELVVKLLRDSTVFLSVGGSSSLESLAEFHVEDNTIRLQGGWMAEMDFIASQTTISDPTAANHFRTMLSWHRAVAVIKILSAYVESMTKEIFNFAFTVRQDLQRTGLAPNAITETPASIGTVFEFGALRGNLGVGFEEIASGCEGRFAIDFMPNKAWQIAAVRCYQRSLVIDSLQFRSLSFDWQRVVNSVVDLSIPADTAHFKVHWVPNEHIVAGTAEEVVDAEELSQRGKRKSLESADFNPQKNLRLEDDVANTEEAENEYGSENTNQMYDVDSVKSKLQPEPLM
jgi:hypothetical protein